MKKIIRDYFTFNARERRGIIALVAIIVLLTVLIHTDHYFVHFDNHENEQLSKEVAALIDQLEEEKNQDQTLAIAERAVESDKVESPNRSEEEKSSSQRFAFNPNQLPKEKWMALGLSEKQAQSVHNYEAEGGNFKVKEDVRKLYVIDDDFFEELKPYIELPEKPEKDDEDEQEEFEENEEDEVLQVEINSADTTALMQIPGIGPYYANEIVALREQLGGIYSLNQLTTLYKFDADKLSQIEPFIEIDTMAVQKLNINEAEPEKLKRHRYINYNMAKSIYNYRQKHGAYTSPEEVMQSHLIDEELFEKIKPYLEL